MQFDDKGNLVPYEIMPCVLADIETYFVDSKHRKRIFRGFCGYQTELQKTLRQSFIQWLGGSFISQALLPKDIDVVNIIEYNLQWERRLKNELIDFFTIGGSVDNYLVDAHLIVVYEETDERYELTVSRIAYFRKWFGTDRMGSARGILALQNN